MVRELPPTRAFVLWRNAANKLLEMESALTLSRTAAAGALIAAPAGLQEGVLKMRVEADALFQLAYAESTKTRSRAHAKRSVGSNAH